MRKTNEARQQQFDKKISEFEKNSSENPRIKPLKVKGKKIGDLDNSFIDNEIKDFLNNSNFRPDEYKPPMNCTIEFKGVQTGTLNIDTMRINFEYRSFGELSEEIQKQYFDLLEKLSKNII